MHAVWFDDQVTDVFGNFLIDAFNAEGRQLTAVEVHDRSTLIDAIGRVEGLEPDVAIVDMRLGQGDERVGGVELVQRLSASWRGPIAILTRYPKHEEIGRFIDPRLQLTEVIKPDSGQLEDLDAWFERDFLPALAGLVESSPSAHMVDGDGLANAREYLGADLVEMDSWTFDTRIASKARAAEPLLSDLDACFEDQSLSYLLVTGWPPRVVRVGRGDDEVPGIELLREEQRAHGSPTILIRRPAMVGLIASSAAGSCSPSAGPALSASRHPDWFPTLQVEIKDREFEIHVDTGSDYTFLGYRLIGDVAPARDEDDYWAPMKVQVGLGPSRVLMVSEWIMNLRARSRTGHLEQRLPMQLVLDFDQSGLAAACRPYCTSFPEEKDLSARVRCRFRPGLIGRDVFRETGWALVVDTVRQRSFVLDQDDPLVGDVKSKKGRKWFAG